MTENRATNVPQEKIEKYMRRFPVVKDLVVYPTPGAAKRFRANFTLNGDRRAVSFGSRYGHTYIDGVSEDVRLRYRARAKWIKDGRGIRTYNKPGSANSFAYWLLW